MIQFANPLWLWGLAGLIIPVAIHLLSRREGKTIPFGTLRFLDETPSSQFRGIRLNEILLLLVRSLCIIILVLFLSGISIKDQSRTKILLIEDAITDISRVSGIIDSLTNAGYQAIKLSEHYDTNRQKLNYWAIAEDLSHQPYESVVLAGTPLFNYFQGERVNLPEHVHWIPVPEGPAENFDLFSTAQRNRSIKRVGYTSADALSFETIQIPNATVATDSIHVKLTWDGDHDREKDWFIAALNAIGTLHKPVALHLNSNTSDSIAWTILLTKEIPENKKNMILSANGYDPGAEIFLQDSVGGSVNNVWIFNRVPDIGRAVEKDFISELAKIITGNELRILADKHDNRIMPDNIMWSSRQLERSTGKTGQHDEARAPWLLLLLVATLFIERILSKSRKQ